MIARFRLAAFLCLLLVCAAYSNTFQNAFHFDDDHVIVSNLAIRDLSNAPRFFVDALTFSSRPANATYRPLVTLSLALDHRLAGGLSPPVYHASQLVLLVALWALLIAFFTRVMTLCRPDPLNRFWALFAATLFAVHTVHTQTMNLMHARSEIFCALGLVGAFTIWLSSARARRWFLYLVPMALGALAKNPAVMLGPLLFAFALRRNGRWQLARAARVAAPALLAGAAVFVGVERANAAGQTLGGGPWLRYALTQPWVWVNYLRLFIFPAGLTADSDLAFVEHVWDTRLWAGLFVLGLLAFVAWRAARRPGGWPIAFGLAWFAITLLPTSSVIPLSEPMNEHRPFLSSIGLVLASVWWLRERLGARPRPVALACGALVLLALSGATFARNRVWATGASLWADVTEKSPQNGRAWMNYGLTFMSRGDYPKARACFDTANRLAPNYPELETNLGIVADVMGNPVEAEMHLRRAVALSPNGTETGYFLARWLVERGRAPEALPWLQNVLRVSPGHGPALALLADLLAARGDGPPLVRLEPPTFQTYYQRGLALAGNPRQRLSAAVAYRQALRIDPTSVDALNNLGFALTQLGFAPQAVPLLEAAVAARPDFALAVNNLAWAKKVAAGR